MTLSAFLGVFRERLATSLAPKTMRSYLLSGRTFASIVGDREIAAYTLADIDQFKAEYSKRVKPTSVNVALRSLKAIFSRAIEWDLLEKSPFARAKMMRVPQSAPAFMTREEQMNFLAVVDDPMVHGLFEFLFNTGLRAGEALALRWEHVDLVRRVAFIVNSELFLTKTRQNRVIPLNPKALQAIPPRSLGPFVFSKGQNPLALCYVSHRFKHYVRMAGLSEALHLHSTRHSFASNLVSKNASLYSVGKLLGHSNPAQTTRLYAHFEPSQMHDVVGLL